MSDQELKDKMLIDLVKDVGTLTRDSAEIKTDLREHMRRTAVLESKTSQLERFFFMTLGAGAFIALIGTVVGILKAVGLI